MKKISTEKPSGSNTNMDELLKELGADENELLGKEKKRFPVDLHPKIHREMKRLQAVITTEDDRNVSNRMLVTEALIDLFKKYEKASAGEDVNVDYVFNPGDSFKAEL